MELSLIDIHEDQQLVPYPPSQCSGISVLLRDASAIPERCDDLKRRRTVLYGNIHANELLSDSVEKGSLLKI